MESKSHSRREVLKWLGVAPMVASGVTDLLAQAPQQPPAPGGAPGAGQGRRAPGGGPGGFGGDFWPGLKHLLFVSDTQTGFQHDSIPHTMATVEKIGRESKTYMTMIKTESQVVTNTPIKGEGSYANMANINAHILPFYDAIFMLPAGLGTMNDQQKADLLAFVHDQGKGLIVGHAATVGFSNRDKEHTSAWPEWHEMIGAGFGGEFNANAKVIVEDPKFPGADAFGTAPFEFYEQHPAWIAPYSREKSRVIMRLDPASLDEKQRAMKPDGDFPQAIAREYGKGRVLNVGWGHFDKTLDDPRMQQMLLGGIKWAMGLVPADVTPRPFPGGNPTAA